MEFDGFDWDAGNREKCQTHGVSIVEVEQLFGGTPFVGPDPLHSQDETRFRAVGMTMDNRHVFVVFTMRRRDDAHLIRPISARFMHAKEVQAYEQVNQDSVSRL